MPLRLAISPCPNDTFMFDAWVNGRIHRQGLAIEVRHEDIARLNALAAQEQAQVVKVSYHAYASLQDRYELLDAGSALGYGCGPLLIAHKPYTLEELLHRQLPVAIPGAKTTANLLLQYFAPGIENRKEMRFDQIVPAILAGEVEAGVIIHENRFTYQHHGLHCLQDLGSYWEAQTGLPIPLGAIIAHKSLGQPLIAQVNELLRQSIAYAFAHPEASMPYVHQHAQEMQAEVVQAHISLYVNDFSLSLGKKGLEAVEQLLAVAAEV